MNKSFFEQLREDVEPYEGPHADLVRWLPPLAEWLASLIEDTRLPTSGRGLVNAAITYLVIPFDVLPESSLGGYGYLDDLYLCAFVAHLLQCEPHLAEMLDEHWAHDRPLGVVVGEVLARAIEALTEDDRGQILFYSGLSRDGAPAR